MTGRPESGKSTLLQRILSHYPQKQGFLTEEMRRDGRRIGFQIQTAEGQTATLAEVGMASSCQVGSFGVNIDGFEAMLPSLLSFSPDQLLYIDEIGQMQLYAKQFPAVVESYIASPNDFIGTISKVYSHDMIRSLMNNSRISLIDLDELGRDGAEAALLNLLQL